MAENQHETDLIKITDTIRRTAKEKGMSLKTLSEKVEISEQGLQLLLRTGNIKLPVLYDIAEALQVDICVLMGCNTSEGPEIEKMRELLRELLKKEQK